MSNSLLPTRPLTPPIRGRAPAGGARECALPVIFPFDHDSAAASRLTDAAALSFATINAQAKGQCHGNLTHEHGKARSHV